jgi:hypothetical protein
VSAEESVVAARLGLLGRPAWPYQAEGGLQARILISEGAEVSPDNAANNEQDRRRARLSASLRENLKRRKTQRRSRAADAPATPSAAIETPASRDSKG